MKPALAPALALVALCSPALGQTTRAQYANQDGSVSPGVTVQCPDPNNAGKSTACQSASAIRPFQSTAAETSHVVCTGACKVWALGFPACPIGDWAMLFDTTSEPADGAVTPAWYALSTAAGITADWMSHPRPMTTGAVVVC